MTVPASKGAPPAGIAPICAPLGPYRFTVIVVPLIMPEIVAVVRYGQKGVPLLDAAIVPLNWALLAPMFADWFSVPVTVRVPFPSVETKVPWKEPEIGATWMAVQVPLEDEKKLHPLARVENWPDMEIALELAVELPDVGKLPVRLKSPPKSFTSIWKFWPLTVPVTGPTPPQPLPAFNIKLPVIEFPDCSKKPEYKN